MRYRIKEVIRQRKKRGLDKAVFGGRVLGGDPVAGSRAAARTSSRYFNFEDGPVRRTAAKLLTRLGVSLSHREATEPAPRRRKGGNS